MKQKNVITTVAILIFLSFVYFLVQRIFWDDDGNRWMQVNEHIYAAMYLVSNGNTYAIPWACPQG